MPTIRCGRSVRRCRDSPAAELDPARQPFSSARCAQRELLLDSVTPATRAPHIRRDRARGRPSRSRCRGRARRARQQLGGEMAFLRAGRRRATDPDARNRRSCIAGPRRGTAHRAARRGRSDAPRCCERLAVELREPAPEVAREPLRPHPAAACCWFLRHRSEEVRDRALLDHQRAVHVGFRRPQARDRAGSPIRPPGW